MKSRVMLAVAMSVGLGCSPGPVKHEFEKFAVLPTCGGEPFPAPGSAPVHPEAIAFVINHPRMPYTANLEHHTQLEHLAKLTATMVPEIQDALADDGCAFSATPGTAIGWRADTRSKLITIFWVADGRLEGEEGAGRSILRRLAFDFSQVPEAFDDKASLSREMLAERVEWVDDSR